MNAKKLLACVKDNGGFTYSLNTQALVTEGFAFSSFKGFEKRFPVDTFSEGDITGFCFDNLVALSNDGVVLGAWVEDGEVYLDISQVTQDENDQIAYYNLGTNETVYVADSTPEGRIALLRDAVTAMQELDYKLFCAVGSVANAIFSVSCKQPDTFYKKITENPRGLTPQDVFNKCRKARHALYGACGLSETDKADLVRVLNIGCSILQMYYNGVHV
jgi:hypothetical protein